jgi:hypothetical protein
LDHIVAFVLQVWCVQAPAFLHNQTNSTFTILAHTKPPQIEILMAEINMQHHSILRSVDSLHELEEQLAVITKRKRRKKKRLQHGGTLKYIEAADQVAASAALVANPSKKTHNSGAPEGALPTQRRCSNCKETGRNVRMCQKDVDASSDSKAIMQYIFSDSSDNDTDNDN